ncbi:hypothetical protein niasHT_006116 [Heterodera trifolii]|uniref:DNA-directed DNA polymerase n=1 Tax=Heterodera trifolii TaxID=157864 RepID=A0ABD2M715_9BILA
MQNTKRYLLVPEEIYQSLASSPPSDGTPIGLVRNRIKQIKNDAGINEAERAIKYEQELKRLNKLTRDEDERPVGVKLENLSDVVAAMPKTVNVKRQIVVATRRHLKVGRARKENVEQLEDDDDDDDHDYETPKPSSSNKRQPTQTEILKLIYKNAQSLGVSEEGQVLRAGGRPFITSSVYDIVSHLLNKDKRGQNKEPTAFKEFVERARQIPLLTILMDLKKLCLLEFLYKDLSSPVAFTSVEPLLREARKTQPKINRTDVQNYLATQRTYTLHRQAKRRYRRLPTLAPGLHTEWQADLAILDRLGKQNRGYKYLLVCIDTLSRQVFVEPVKTKTSTNMIIAFGRIFKRSKYIPWKVLTDQGKEFTARAVQQFFRAKDVEHFCMLTSPQFHAGMAERANRSIKERLYRYFTERNTYKWIDVVQDIVRAINHSPNSSIGMRPADVNFKNAEALRQKLHNSAENVVRRQPRYRVGDRVRIHRVEASGWQAHACTLAALCVGSAYWFTNCVTRAKYQRLDCWFRIGVGGPNALVVPHVAPEFPANIPPMLPVQIGAGRDAVRVPPNVTNAGDEQRVDADLDNNNNNDNVGLEPRSSRSSSRTAGARPTQRRAAEPAGRPIGECFVIERSTAMRNVPRNTRGEICELRFLPLEEAQRPDLLMEAIVQQLLDRVLAGHPRPSMVGLQLHPPGFDRPYVIGLRPPEQNNAAALAAAIERLNEQSAAGIDLLAGTTVTKVLAVWPLDTIRADPQRGGACDRDVEHHVSNSVQSLVRIHNPNDRLCLARAVLLGMHDRETRMAGGGGKAAFNLFASRQDQHGPAAAQMLTRAGIATNQDMYTLDDVQRLQQWINDEHGVGQIRLVVLQKEQEYRIVFKGEGLAAKFNLCLVLERGHFNYIGRVEQLFDVPNYCIDCERRADARYHAFGCKVACRLCLRYGPGYPCHTEQLPNGGSTARKCADCQFVFPNDGCYNFHLTNNAPAPMDGRGQRQRQPICQWRRVCRACGRVAYVSTHQCPRDQPADDGICQRCNGPHTVDEPCYIQPIDDGSVRQRASIALDNDDSDDDDDDDDDLPLRLCFFDAETSQDTPLQLNNRTVQKHVPLLIVAEVICERCLQAGISVNDGLGRRAPGCVCMTGMVRGQLFRQWSSPPFANALGDNSASPVGAPAFNQRRFFFHSFDNDGSDPVDQFLDFLLHHGPKKAHTVCIAHNGGKYDFHLVLEALHRRNRPPKHLCTTGLKIYSMSLSGRHQRRITFKDSINYFFCALDALVKSFDVPDHLATLKPFFPYLYIRRQHLSQRLINLPAQEFYAPDTMKAEKRAQFLRWHADNNGNGFQLREQLIMYCVNDVAILRESVIRFRQLIADNTQGLDPFLHASTAAGLALATFRRCFLPANRLVHSPEGGYLRGRRASAESQRYIRFFELEHPEAQVQCASWSVGEAHIEDSGYRVDGLWRRDGPLRPLAIEWLGCYYHGCRVCFPDRQQQLAAGRTAEDLYERTERRLFELEHDHGCDLHVVWACQWAERLRHDPDLKRRYDAVFVPCPLDPRNDALRGGRTEPFKLHHVCSDDEEIMCIDIVSLYPYVMVGFPFKHCHIHDEKQKANRFPVGIPRVLTREVLLRPPTAPLPWNAPENNIFRGLLLVRVLAPRNIRVPLLGYRTKDGRFTFPLCAWCADRRQQRPCRHDDDKRSWVTAYTHVELNKALQLGYVVTDLFEVWDYEEWDGTLFSSYVNTFVGLKVQATGWPEGCVTDEQRQAFVQDFERTEGIRLDSTKMEFNPGLRLIAKTLSNSLWGKLAQRVGQTEIRYTRTPAEFHALLDDPTVDKLDFVHVSDHMDRCVVRKRPEFARAPLTNCLPVAAFVTSYGRLHLYDYMEQVSAIDGAELLYCGMFVTECFLGGQRYVLDTDSIYYVNKMGGPCVAEGEALGQMKRELTDRRIVEFVAGGPKNYGIRHTARDGTDERANLKIRSFRLSYTAQQLLTFEAMKDLTLATYNIDGPIDDALDNDDLYVYGGGEHRAIRVNFPQIDRNVYADLYTHEAHKDYRPFYAKGRVRPGMQTCPFGYVEDDGQPNEGQRTHRRKRNFVEQDPTQPGHSGWF